MPYYCVIGGWVVKYFSRVSDRRRCSGSEDGYFYRIHYRGLAADCTVGGVLGDGLLSLCFVASIRALNRPQRC